MAWFYGGSADQIFDGAWGGSGSDYFVFNDNHGNDTINNFIPGTDYIYLNELTGVSKYSDLTITADGADVLINTGQGTVRLKNTSLDAVDAGCFTFRLDGTSGNDTLTRGVGNNYIYGGLGNDTIYGGADDDLLYGGAGNDSLYGGADDDELYGGAGDDSLYGGAGDDSLQGGAGDDSLTGGAGEDLFIFAPDSGDDTIKDFTNGTDKIDLSQIKGIYGLDDLTITQDGDDTVISLSNQIGEGTGTIRIEDFSATNLDASDFNFRATPTPIVFNGDDSNETIRGGESDDSLYGGGGDDNIYSFEGNDNVFGGAGNDYIDTGYGEDNLYGGAGRDFLYGGGDDDVLYGGAGNDWVKGGTGDDDLYGGAGDDSVGGHHGTDLLYGGSGSDFMDGGHGNDTIYGGDDGDEIYGGTVGNYGGVAGDDDLLYGGAGSDRIGGMAGNDTIYGDAGNDTLYGGTGNDNLYGGTGNDNLYGGAGNDILHGGTGNDTFVFGINRGNDTIKDFTDGDDTIDLSAITGISGFSDLTLTQDGEDVVISLDSSAANVGTGTIRLEDFSVSDLDADDFLFAEAPTLTVAGEEL